MQRLYGGLIRVGITLIDKTKTLFNRLRNAAGVGVQATTAKITAGAQQMGSTVQGGAKQVLESVGCGARMAYEKIATVSTSRFTWLKATALAGLTTVSKWSNTLKESSVSILHRIRTTVTNGYFSAKDRFQSWWQPKYVIPVAVSTDEVQRAAQKHQVRAQHVSIANPENIVQVAAVSPVKRIQNRIIGLVQHVVLTCRGVIAGVWHQVKTVCEKIVRGGVAAGKRGWHTVRNAVWKQKERLPWNDSTHRGVKTTSPTKMARH